MPPGPGGFEDSRSFSAQTVARSNLRTNGQYRRDPQAGKASRLSRPPAPAVVEALAAVSAARRACVDGGPEAPGTLSVALRDLARVYLAQDQPRSAVTSLEEAERLERTAIDEADEASASSVDRVDALAITLSLLGSAWLAIGDRVRARSHLEGAIVLYRRQVDLDSGSSFSLRQLSVTLLRYGMLLRDLGELKGASGALAEVIVLRTEVVEARGDVKSVSELGLGFECRADVKEMRGRYTEAEQDHARNVALRREAADMSASDPERLHFLSVALTRYARFWQRRGNPERGRPLVEEALVLERRAVEGRHEAPTTASSISDLSAALVCLAGIEEDLGMFDQARRAYHESLELLRSCIELYGETEGDMRAVMSGLGHLVVVNQALGDVGAVERYAQEILALEPRLREFGPVPPENRGRWWL